MAVTAQNLLPAAEAGEQLDLLSPAAYPRRQKVEKLERAMDNIRRKYGRDAISPARLKERRDGPEEDPKA